MKRRMNAGSIFIIMLSLVAICLSGCSTTYQQLAKVNPQETPVPSIADPGKPVKYDVDAKLRQTEDAAAAKERTLQEDASLTQTDMNELSYEIYMIWDDTLNELWQALKESVDEETMNRLLQEQRTWITEKEKEVQQAGAAYEGGSIAPLVENQKAAELTKTRVYELANYLRDAETN